MAGLADIPFLAGYTQQGVLNREAEAHNLRQTTGQMGLLAQLRQQQEMEQLKPILQQFGGDPEKAIRALIATGNQKAAELAVKLKGMMPKPAEPFSLSQGQRRFNPQGQVIAEMPAAPQRPLADTRPEVLRLSEALEGLPLDHPTRPRIEARLKYLGEGEPKAEREKWSDPYKGPGGSLLQRSTTGQIRPVLQREPVPPVGDKAPSGYRWGPLDQSGNPTAVPIPGTKAAADAADRERKNLVGGESQQQMLKLVDNMIADVKANPRQTSGLLAAPIRGIEAVQGVLNPMVSRPGIEMRQNRDFVLGVSRDLFRGGRLSNLQLQRIESALGGTSITTAQNTLDALSEIRIALGGKPIPDRTSGGAIRNVPNILDQADEILKRGR